MRFFESKCTVLKKVLVTLLGLFGTRRIVTPLPPSLRPFLLQAVVSSLEFLWHVKAFWHGNPSRSSCVMF